MITREEAIRRLEEVAREVEELKAALEEGWNEVPTKNPTHAERRSKLDVLGRFFVLERAKILLETATYFQNYRQDEEVEYWELSGVVDEVRVVVIMRSIKKGSKHLFSVIRRGTVSTPKKQ